MFQSRLQEVAQAVQTHLDEVLAPMQNVPVVEAARYTLQGGKRLRAFLVMETARLHDIPDTAAIWPASAIECIHAYSLVHDDMPCMDDDDLRRGRPTIHVKWDEATAVLAGDALQSLGFELASHPEVSPHGAVRADLALSLARASGMQGMVLGQALDIAAETAEIPLTLEDIIALQRGKTGALFEWSATAGARMAQADITPFQTYAAAFGLAFQIADDILDIEGDPEKAGKRLGKDQEAGKATYVSLLGLDGAKKRAKDLIDEACDAISPYGSNAENLASAAKFVIARDR